MLNDNGAFVYLHDDVLLIGTCSGPGACVLDDWERPVLKVKMTDISDSEIGRSIRVAWSHCREINSIDEFLEKNKTTHKECMEVKSLKKLYAKTKSVAPLLKNGVIIIRATYQNRIGGFVGLDEKIELQETVSDEELGKAVREMLNQSKTSY